MADFALDCEFIENGNTIEVISIGIQNLVTRQTLYLISTDFDPEKANEFVKEQVLPKLPPKNLPDGTPDSRWKPESEFGPDILEFCGGPVNWESGDANKPHFYAWFGSYDWVCLCQRFGTMMQMPEGWPRYIRDVKQMVDDVETRIKYHMGITPEYQAYMTRLFEIRPEDGGVGRLKLPPKSAVVHDALEDAKWVGQVLQYIRVLYPVSSPIYTAPVELVLPYLAGTFSDSGPLTPVVNSDD